VQRKIQFAERKLLIHAFVAEIFAAWTAPGSIGFTVVTRKFRSELGKVT